MTDGQRGGEPPGLDDRDPCTLDDAFLEIEKLQRKAGNLNQMVEDLRDKDDILTGAVAALRAEVDAMTARHRGRRTDVALHNLASGLPRSNGATHGLCILVEPVAACGP